MKCQCDKCNGNGVVKCDQCAGAGDCEGSIEHATIPIGHKHEEELKWLRRDVLRIRDECRRLCELVPSRAPAYQAQLRGALFIVEAQADKLYKNR